MSTMRSVCHLLRDRAHAHGGSELFRFLGASASLAEVEERSNRLANVLADNGVGRGDRVGVMLPNGIDFPVTWLGVAKTGAIVVPINTRYQQLDLAHVLDDSGASAVVASGDALDVLEPTLNGRPSLERVFMYDADGGKTLPGMVDVRPAIAGAGETWTIDHLRVGDPVTIQYTSGTTGRPKGCVLTHDYWLTLGSIMQSYTGLSHEDTALSAQPFYYMDPIWNMVLCLLAGATLVILPRFSASTFWRSVKDNDATFFYCLGTMPLLLMKQPDDPSAESRHRVRLVLCSGIPAQLHAAIESRYNCLWRETYGATELGCVLMVPPDDLECVGSGAMGAPVPGWEVKLLSADGVELPEGEVGQLVVRGAAMMVEYYENLEATREWMVDGWARTGDLCYRDSKGYYHLVGRLKDMIRRGGENISAAEVEAALCEHPAVKAAACVPVPDEIRGEEVKAFVQLLPTETPESSPPQAIIDFARTRIASFKTPRFIEYVADFPMTPSQRIAKHELVAGAMKRRTSCYDYVTKSWVNI